MPLWIKDPHSQSDYALDWQPYLGDRIIAQSAWSLAYAAPDGLSIVSESRNLQTTGVRVAGGKVGHVYRLTNQVILSDGQIDERSLTIRVEER